MDVKQSQKAGNNAIQIQQTVVGDNNYVVGIEIENDSRKPNDNQPKRSLLRRLAAFLNDMVSPLSKAMPRWHPDGLLAGHFLFAQRLQNNYRLCGAPQTGRKLVFNQ